VFNGLSAQMGYIMPLEYEMYYAGPVTTQAHHTIRQ